MKMTRQTLIMKLAIVLSFVSITIGLLVQTAAGPTLPKGVVSTDYLLFKDTAEAGFMQIVTVPSLPSMYSLDSNGFLVVDRSGTIKGAHTYAIDSYSPTGGYFQAWSFDGHVKIGNIDTHGIQFKIDEVDMFFLFSHGAYALSYDQY